jgi:hypothetical protein
VVDIHIFLKLILDLALTDVFGDKGKLWVILLALFDVTVETGLFNTRNNN